MGKLGLALLLAGGLALGGCGQSDTNTGPSTSAPYSASVASTVAPSVEASSSVPPVPVVTASAVPSVSPTGPDRVCPPVLGLQLLTRGPDGKDAANCGDAAAVVTEYGMNAPGTRTVQGWECAPVGNQTTDVAVTRCTKGKLTLNTYSTRNVSPATATQDQAFLAQLRISSLPLAISVPSVAANNVTAALGHQVCAQLTSNIDYETIANGISAAFPYNPDDARSVITASVLTLCPQFKSRVGG
jgi:Protein of unknown function (DUF732)